ncbi:hypothetical protein [Cellulomonas fimi]|uniref:Uncharacterized protein n=1 Tax=Cellulomonas fimi TaxID=1708 RepID=A0A7Y0LXC6_CELFI|nr:hypothetical protein [Cellulomonas fimi]NMR19644.1 hypothetical protein [Cellulomonas fimi]
MDRSTSPPDGPQARGRSRRGALGPRLTTFVVVDALLVLAFLVVLVLFLSSGPGTGGDAAPDDGATPAATGPTSPGAAPSAGSAGDDDTTFALPSGNIACEMSTDAATCTIANTTATPPPDAGCTGVIGRILTVTAEGAEMPCVEGALPGVAAPGTAVLEYGDSTTVGDFTCTSSSTGVTCRHDPSGRGFALARARAELF